MVGNLVVLTAEKKGQKKAAHWAAELVDPRAENSVALWAASKAFQTAVHLGPRTVESLAAPRAGLWGLTTAVHLAGQMAEHSAEQTESLLVEKRAGKKAEPMVLLRAA